MKELSQIIVKLNKYTYEPILSTYHYEIRTVTNMYFQFLGFSQIIENGYYFTGSESSITTSFIYLVVLLHLAHIVVGLICLLVVIYNHYKQKYQANNLLGVELMATFWHFVDILWIYLFLFLYFVR